MADKPTGVLSPEVEKLSDKLAKDPNSKVFFNLAEEYAKAGMTEEALVILTTGLKIHPSYVSANVLLGKLYFEKGMIKESRELFEQILKINPDNITANKKLALIYIDEKKFSEAEKCCGQILFFNPKDAETLEIKKNIVLAKEGKIEAKMVPAPQPAPAPPKAAPVPPAVPKAVPAPPVAPPKAVPVPAAPPDPVQPDFAVAPGQAPMEVKDNVAVEEPSQKIYDPTISRPPDLIDFGSGQEPEKPLEAPLDFAASLSAQEESDASPGPSDILVVEPPAAEVPVQEEAKAAGTDSPPVEFIGSSPEEPSPVEASAGIQNNDFSDLLPEAAPQALPALSAAPPQGGGKNLPGSGDLETLALADLYIKQGHFPKGIEIYNKLLEKDPGNQALRQKVEEAKSLGNLLGHKASEKKIEEKIIQAVVPEQMAPPSDPGQKISEKNQAKIVKLKQWLEYIKKKNQ
ncbi:MAG TPA: tetratricopeptide repeat protein [Nitrospiria bacterium]|nr:tetratricopeptide repeat protein [Nitrospiria bacterium]